MIESLAGLVLFFGGTWVFDVAVCVAMDKWL